MATNFTSLMNSMLDSLCCLDTLGNTPVLVTQLPENHLDGRLATSVIKVTAPDQDDC
jgi:hypothetical protein